MVCSASERYFRTIVRIIWIEMIVFVIYCFSSYPRLYNVYEPAPNFMYNRIIIYNILSHYYEFCVILSTSNSTYIHKIPSII